MVIYMEHYSAASSAPAASRKDRTYADEIMYANWNPAVLNMTREPLRAAPGRELPEDLSTVEVDAFLDRVYALATLS